MSAARLTKPLAELSRASCYYPLIISTALSAIMMTGALVLPPVLRHYGDSALNRNFLKKIAKLSNKLGPSQPQRKNHVCRCALTATSPTYSKKGSEMPSIQRPKSPEESPRVKAVFDDIRETRGSDFINNIWKYLAFDESLLERTWEEVKEVMATPSELDPLTKELLYLAVSIINNCEYCIHSHSAAARAKGMTPTQHGEVLKIVSLAAKTNHLSNAMQVPVDPEFIVPVESGGR